MRKLILAFLFCTSVSAFAQTTTLPEGTIVSVTLLKEISSKNANTGDVLDFETSEPIIMGDKVLVPKGAKVSGTITDCAKAKGLGKAGTLNFDINYLHLSNGKTVKLSSSQSSKGKQKTGAAVAQAVLLTPLFLLKKGKNIKLKEGQLFKVFVQEDTEI